MKHKKYIVLGLIAVVFASSLFSFANIAFAVELIGPGDSFTPTGPGGSGVIGGPGSSVVTPDPVIDTGVSGGPMMKLLNPLKVTSISELLQLILQIVTLFATPIIIFFIIYAGFLFVTAQGKPDQITKARNALLYSLIGGAIILGANILLTIILTTVKSLQP